MFSPLKTSAVISQSPGKSISPTQIVQSMFYNVHTVQKLKKITSHLTMLWLQMSEWLKLRYCISNVADEDNTEENEVSTRELFLLTFTIYTSFISYIYYLLSLFSRKNCATYTALFLMFLKTLMSYTAWHRCQIILC